MVGTIDYLIDTLFSFQTGVVDSLISSTFIDMKNHLFNRKSLKFFRSSLRNRSTSAEAELWNILKSKKLNARKFRRQHSIGNYIVDFFCASEKLVIELDGNPHGEYHKIEKDKKKRSIS